MKNLYLVTEDPEIAQHETIPTGGSFYFADSADEAFILHKSKLLTIDDEDTDPADYRVLHVDYPNSKIHVHMFNFNMGDWDDIDSTFDIQ